MKLKDVETINDIENQTFILVKNKIWPIKDHIESQTDSLENLIWTRIWSELWNQLRYQVKDQLKIYDT